MRAGQFVATAARTIHNVRSLPTWRHNTMLPAI